MVGLSLGLTGGGGSLFAVPLLVYGLALAPHDAIGVSLISVGVIALIGVLRRIQTDLLVPRGAALMAMGGAACAPLGSWLASKLPEPALLIAFSLLMIGIALLMWRTAGRAGVGKEVPSHPDGAEPPSHVACRFDPAGRLRMTSRCALRLMFAGSIVGLFSGLFGVGGGFLVVPALIYTTGMSVHRAVATSLLVIVLVSLSGSAMYVVTHPAIPWGLVASFVAGGVAGLEAGGRLARRVGGVALQRGFAGVIVLVGAFVIARTLIHV